MSDIESATITRHVQLKNQCLIREGFRCLFTGHLDISSHEKQLITASDDDLGTCTECCYIVTHALREFDERDAAEIEGTATIWFSLRRYFPDLQSREIGPGTIDQPANAMTLSTNIHAYFNKFYIAFKGTNIVGFNSPSTAQPQLLISLTVTAKPNQYKILRYTRFRINFGTISGTDTVKFIQHDPSVPLPDPYLLEVHRRVANILWASGYNNWLFQRERDPDDIAPDGSTPVGEIVSRRLLIHQPL